ncbi:NEP1-interacting protein 2 [Hordeum vulgare]|uniref:Predicted protein n=1 Tax=Hordeum vulgare subsp. vulgare TaxID=112509 RepID=F2D4N2_HORVV|nr:NEP1-interacting protein 2 [Hordeum vulgare]BAJ90053.1 predicted protein [Hordeum vulgare subsp. vulgare]
MVAVSRVAGGLARALLFGVFAAAGTVVGAAYGLLSGFVDEEDGFLHGMLLGAVGGALASLDLAHSLLAIWCRRHVFDHCSPAGRIKRTVGVVLRLTALADPHYCGRRGDPAVVGLEQPPRSSSFGFFPPAAVAAAGGSWCPICLQEFEAGGERAGRRLPACSHVFHLDCIRSWLLRKPDCPMCRHAVH